MPDCPRCGAENADDAKFCNQCGTALQPIAATPRRPYTPPHLVERVLRHRSAIEGERKQVTVLFADMVGSTRLADQVDAEVWHQILDEFFGLLGEEIHRYEGTINQYTGDGVMALFGAPIAHEDHARRAALATLTLQQRLRSFSDRLRLERGLNLSTRMGLNSGEVVVGRIGDDLRMDYTAQGLTVNLAARMEQIAEPGRVYLTRDTAELIRDYFQLRALGPMPVPGRDGPVDVFELQAQSAISLRLEAARERGLTRFSGRERELERLLAAQRASAAGEKRLLVIVGDAGLGKSRLCFEARQRWEQAGVSVVATSGLPAGQGVPIQPVRDLLRQRFGIQATDSAAVARQKLAGGLLMLAPETREQLPLIFDFLDIADPQAPPIQLSPEAREERLLELYRRICALGGSEPRVILVEDLHWIAAGAQEFFKHTVDCACPGGTLVLFNTRPGPLPDWLLARRPEILTLEPLDETAMTAMSASLLGDDPALAPLAGRIAAQAAGNPFFIEETVRALAACGQLEGEPGRYHLAGKVEDIAIPASVQALIASRVDRLDGEDKSLLQTAAVLGARFDARLLAAVAGLAPAELATSLRRLEQGNYLRADEAGGEDQWQFCHPLFQEVVYASQLSRKRRELHKRVAELLESHAAENPDCPEVILPLAHHWSEAGEVLPAARWTLAAVARAMRENVVEELRLLRRAIALLEPLPAAPEAVELAIRARAGMLRVASFYPVAAEEVENYYREGRELAEGAGNRAILAELLISNGIRLLNDADADSAMENTGEAMRLAQQLGDIDLEQRFRIPILFSYFAAGRVREGLAVLDSRDGGAWHEGPVTADTMLSRGFRALMLATIGELDRAQREGEAAIDCARREEIGVSWMYANMVDIRLLRGLNDGCLDLADTAVSQAETFGSPMFMEVAQRARAQALLAESRPEEARAALEATLELVAPGGVARQFEAAHRGVLAQALRALGEHSAALAEAERGVAAGERGRQRIWTLRARLQRARALLALGRDPEAELARISRLIEDTGARVFDGDVAHIRGLHHQQAGDGDAAQASLDAAAGHYRRCGAEKRARKLLSTLAV